METTHAKQAGSWMDRIRSFVDYFILFSGISTASNLSRTRKEPVRKRGLFLFRRPSR